MAHVGHNGGHRQASGHEREPVERQVSEGGRGAEAYPANSKQRQPPGDGQFVAELEKQQQGK